MAHGQWLATNNAEATWGWATAAGVLRAERRAELTCEAAGLGPGIKALEIGCGSGVFTEKYAATGSHITACELSGDLIALARERGLDPSRVQFHEASFEDLGGLGPYDAIIGNSVLHHLELDSALEKCMALLKPGGRLAFAEPNLLNPQIFLERRFRRFFPHISEDEIAFIRFSLRKQLNQHGFVGVDITPFDWLHPAIPKKMIPLVGFVGRIFESLPGICEFSGSLIISAQKPSDHI